MFSVNDTLKTINITTVGATLPASGSNTMFTPFESYQILDIHTFQTTAWNISIFLEVQKISNFLYLYYFCNSGTNYIYVSAPHLTNKTGLYYVGIGVLDTTGKDCVEFHPPPGMEGRKWCFMRGVRFDVFARALTKGCYHYDNSADRFTSIGEMQNITASMIVIVMTVHMLFIMIFVVNCEMIEADKKLLAVIGTGIRSVISPNMNERFGIRSLGEIRYLRIWVDNSGRGHRESWYCNRVFVKDLHTGSIYRFPVHDWLGQCMGDGASERLSAAETNVNLVNDSMSIHILAETISYIAMYTGK
ncbi:hypothetical protein ANCCEY_09331 [Ancylostoma ceylanicum]|uniref:PLAT domain-containing protein n=1 Tax=Ancylostoma ceylanicum TaxID=53326 RepID=A0A0D6LK90_9BILA|nr:hypothetical protein ANCCEY_09331 [Ancylostoma ceylanicum]